MSYQVFKNSDLRNHIKSKVSKKIFVNCNDFFIEDNKNIISIPLTIFNVGYVESIRISNCSPTNIFNKVYLSDDYFQIFKRKLEFDKNVIPNEMIIPCCLVNQNINLCLSMTNSKYQNYLKELYLQILLDFIIFEDLLLKQIHGDNMIIVQSFDDKFFIYNSNQKKIKVKCRGNNTDEYVNNDSFLSLGDELNIEKWKGYEFMYPDSYLSHIKFLDTSKYDFIKTEIRNYSNDDFTRRIIYSEQVDNTKFFNYCDIQFMGQCHSIGNLHLDFLAKLDINKLSVYGIFDGLCIPLKCCYNSLNYIIFESICGANQLKLIDRKKCIVRLKYEGDSMRNRIGQMTIIYDSYFYKTSLKKIITESKNFI